MAFQIGRGRSPKEVADDPMIQSTVPAVTQAAASVGLVFGDRPDGNVSITLPDKTLAKLREQARTRRQSPDDLAGLALTILADDAVLMENVLDDC